MEVDPSTVAALVERDQRVVGRVAKRRLAIEALHDEAQ